MTVSVLLGVVYFQFCGNVYYLRHKSTYEIISFCKKALQLTTVFENSS